MKGTDPLVGRQSIGTVKLVKKEAKGVVNSRSDLAIFRSLPSIKIRFFELS